MVGVSYTVEVTAATLYEAIAQVLAAIRGNEWVAEIAHTSTSKMAADEELDGNVVICRWAPNDLGVLRQLVAGFEHSRLASTRHQV
jgi:hypothetical protein